MADQQIYTDSTFDPSVETDDDRPGFIIRVRAILRCSMAKTLDRHPQHSNLLAVSGTLQIDTAGVLVAAPQCLLVCIMSPVSKFENKK